MTTDSGRRDGLSQLRMLGRIGLTVAGLSVAALVGVVLLLGPAPSGDYGATVAFHVRARALVDQGLLLASLGLTAITAVVTWLISLYSSFRVAGPLYRFGKNLEELATRDLPRLLPLRADDELQAEAGELNAAAAVLAEHYASLQAAIDACERTIDENRSADALAATLEALQAQVRRAQV